MFMAELASLVLTAGHDLDSLEGSLRADVSADGDRYELLNGAEAVLVPGDMLMADGAGIVSMRPPASARTSCESTWSSCARTSSSSRPRR
jgi:DNA/RNA-binding domain of Phe-tRNA-synthetase-like protein